MTKRTTSQVYNAKDTIDSKDITKQSQLEEHQGPAYHHDLTNTESCLYPSCHPCFQRQLYQQQEHILRALNSIATALEALASK